MMLRLALCAALAAALSLVVRGAEPAPAPMGDAEVQKLIQNLSSEDFDTREKAETDLKKAGPGAIPLLTKALEGGDAETRARGRRVLDELQWAVLQPVPNVAEVLPPETILLVHTPSLKAGIQKLRTETAVGKLYDRPELAEMRALANDAATKRMNPAEKKVFDAFFDRYGGPACISLITTDPTKDWQERDQGVMIVGLNDPDAAKAYVDFNEVMPLSSQAEQVMRERYRGIEFQRTNGEWRQEGRARVLNLLVNSLDSSYQSVKLVIDQAGNAKAAKLSAAPAFLEAQGKVDAAPIAALYFSVDELIKQLSKKEPNAHDKAILEALGFDAVKTVAVSMSAGNDLIAERAWVKVQGAPKGVVKLLSFPKTTGKFAALAPADALAMVTVPSDGKMIYDTILGISKLTSPNDAAQFEAAVAQLSEGLGINIVDQIIAPLTGEASLWVSKPAGPMPIPDLGAAFETKDEASAKALADGLAKLLAGAMGKPEACGAADFKGHACHWLNKEALGPDAPYVLSWCADGARVLFASSQQGLQTLINRIENKATGLDAADDYKRLIASMPEAERGGMIYINTAELGGWGLPILLPFIAGDAPPEVREKVDAALKDPKGLLKGFPGTLLSIKGVDDGLQARAFGGISATANVISVPIIVGQIMFRRMMQEMEKANPAPVEDQAEAPAAEAKTEEAKTEEAKSEAPAPAPAPEK